MFGFLIKKTFFDMWDNLLRIVLMNLGFIAAIAIFLFRPFLIPYPILWWACLLVGVAFTAVYAGAASRMTSDIADYKAPGFSDFWQYVKETYVTSLLFALVLTAYIFVVRIAFSFYGGLESFIGPVAISLLFWVSAFIVLATQYFCPIQSRMNKEFRKVFKKAFLLLLDNPGFTISMLICAIIITVLSIFTAFIIPGFATLLLFWNVGLKLRLYKYDYLEKNPDASRRHIPWDSLLVDDREKVGKRTLKGMIFPWKE